ncbi:MAG: sugar ABC transporter permease [Planctomycetota bacterium]|jgi:putative multiple sugar transport system permease protein|nr:sugar ABC transporter permease [Planctomycetota bacterium]
MARLLEILKRNTMLIVLIFVMIMFEILIRAHTNGFGSLFRPTNVTNLVNQNGYVVILTCGMLLCILTGGNIDLSIGSIVALVGAIAGVLMVNWKLDIHLSSLLCLLIGLGLGAWQAFWIAYVKIPPFIVTLAGMLAFRGFAWLILGGLTISAFPAEFSRYFNSFLPGGGGGPGQSYAFTLAAAVLIGAALAALQIAARIKKIGKGYEVEPLWETLLRAAFGCFAIVAAGHLLGRDKGVPVILILLAAVVLVYNFFTTNTVPGRQLYAMGGNEKAARLSGVDTDRLMFFAYANMGFLSAVAALICVARFDTANPSAGLNYELDAIGACFIGGASAYGGVGTIFGCVIGAIFMGVLNNGMSLLGMGADWQRAVKGLVLLAAVVFDVLSQRRKRLG